MKRSSFFAVLLIAMVIQNNTYAQDSSLDKLIKRVKELRVISDDRKDRIDELELIVYQLTQQMNTHIGDKSKLKKTIREKTQAILILRGQLSDLTYEYEKMTDELKRLGIDNDELRNVISDIEDQRKILIDSLASTNDKIVMITTELKKNKMDAEILSAKNNALEQRIDELVNYSANVTIIEANTNLPYSGYYFSATFGKITKGGNLLYGVGLGYAFYSNTDYGLSARGIPISAVFKVALDRKSKLGFSTTYLCGNDPVNAKFFGSVEFSYLLSLTPENASTYNKGGFSILLGVGRIFDTNENVKPYLIAGFRAQQLIRKTDTFVDDVVRTGLHFGAGFYF